MERVKGIEPSSRVGRHPHCGLCDWRGIVCSVLAIFCDCLNRRRTSAEILPPSSEPCALGKTGDQATPADVAHQNLLLRFGRRALLGFDLFQQLDGGQICAALPFQRPGPKLVRIRDAVIMLVAR